MKYIKICLMKKLIFYQNFGDFSMYERIQNLLLVIMVQSLHFRQSQQVRPPSLTP